MGLHRAKIHVSRNKTAFESYKTWALRLESRICWCGHCLRTSPLPARFAAGRWHVTKRVLYRFFPGTQRTSPSALWLT
jgi:hypothetical protein